MANRQLTLKKELKSEFSRIETILVNNGFQDAADYLTQSVRSFLQERSVENRSVLVADLSMRGLGDIYIKTISCQDWLRLLENARNALMKINLRFFSQFWGSTYRYT